MSSSSPLLSIIIPHYNVSDYIDCLYTVLFPQINETVELILIEDCSTDNTKEKMKQWEEKNKNPHICFHYFSQNLGLSEARNRGTALASGEYVWFIDSDDTIKKNAISHLIKTIQSTRADAIVFDFFRFYGEKDVCNKEIEEALLHHTEHPLRVVRSIYRSLPENALTRQKDMLLFSLFQDAQMYVCFFVIKTKYWLAHPFPRGKNYEDITVIPKIIDHIDSLYYLQMPLYYYRQRESSIINAPTIESCFDMSDAVRYISDYFKEHTLSQRTRIALYTFYLRMLRLSYGNLVKYHLMDTKILARYQKSEDIFLSSLPWNKYLFIVKMNIYPIFKFTSLLFLTNKKIYILVKNILGKY